MRREFSALGGTAPSRSRLGSGFGKQEEEGGAFAFNGIDPGAAAAKGEDWASDWEPYVMGAYVTLDRKSAQEISWATGYDAQCADVTVTAGDPLPRPKATLALADDWYQSGDSDFLTMLDVLAAAP